MKISSRPGPGEVVVPLRTVSGKLAPVTHLRSTLLASSIQTLRARGWFDAYLQLLPGHMHETVLGAVAGSWMPISIGMAHYAAADALGLSVQQQFDNGREVADRIQNTLLGTLVKTAKGMGVTPWTGMEHFQRLWDRLMLGGSAAIYRLGPKEARVEAHGVPFVGVPYFRNAWRGMFAGSGALFCSRMFVSEIPSFAQSAIFAMRVAWA